jgi:membrane-associated protease RseP (regulator of RpoE activity)
MNYAIVFALISFLILIHEFGHLIAAKLSNIPIERFSIGFGPKLWAFSKGQTEYRLSVLPIGGYVLPVLPLDGGKILFCFLEKIHHSLAKLRMPLMVTGWVLLLGLILSITVMDVCKLALTTHV